MIDNYELATKRMNNICYITVIVLYILTFCTSLGVFIYVFCIKRRTEPFLFISPASFFVISLALVFRYLNLYYALHYPSKDVWFRNETIQSWLSAVNNFCFMLYNWLFASQYFRSSLIFPKLVVNSHIDAYISKKIKREQS